MRYLAALFCLASLTATSAFAGADWVGNAKLKVNRRGSNYESNISARGLDVNLCDYGTRRIELEVYQAGVTDTDSAVWEKIDASMQTVQNETGKVIKEGRPRVIGRSGNNAVYEIYLPGISPDSVPLR